MLWISLHLPLPLAACPGLPDSLLRYTPRLTVLEPRLIALDITGSLHLFHGPLTLWRRILRTCPSTTRGAMAPTPWGAALLACRPHGPRRVLRPESLRRRLDELPCDVLTLTPAAAALLDDWGCRTLGQLRHLPRSGLAQRGLAGLLSQIDRAYHPRPLTTPWYVPRPVFQATREPDYHGTNLSAIETALGPLLDDLCRHLQAHQAATDHIEIILHHDTARCLQAQTRLGLAFHQPQWQPTACLRLCRLRLQAMVLPGPVRQVTLCCLRLQPRQSLPGSLLPDAQADRQREERLLDILKARLGDACMHFPKLQDWPLPEHAESWSPQPRRRASELPPRPLQADSRPFWLLPAPIPLETLHRQPVWHGSTLGLMSGPERIEGGWWRPQSTARDYFIAHDSQAGRYWIYRDLETGGWFLHGLFA